MPRTGRTSYEDRITTDPEIVGGKPIIRGTRIPVQAVLEHLAENPDLDGLFAAYPRLAREDVQAALAYAHLVLAEDARRRNAARARRFRRVLAIARRNPDGDGDALLEELEREDAERRATDPRRVSRRVAEDVQELARADDPHALVLGQRL